ncbi:hypothetical protein D3C75_197350 [compost metagenome]
MIVIGGKSYELMANHKEGWNPEGFRGRYSEVLDRYDYIVGDWGYGQLRLKGFYRDNHPKANRDSAISGFVDYINEYCNFGCAYFVLRKMKDAPRDPLAKDILIKEPPEVPKESAGAAEAGDSAGAETPVRDEEIPQISSRKYQAESAVSKEQPVKEQGARENAPRDKGAKERGRDNRNKEFQGKRNRDSQPKEAAGREGQPRGGQRRDNQNRDNQNRDNQNRDNQVREGQGRENSSRSGGPRESQSREPKAREQRESRENRENQGSPKAQNSPQNNAQNNNPQQTS